MGRFDTLHCDYPLPDPEFQHEEFQTKDLERTLDRYRIGADGQLWRLSRRIRRFKKAARPPEASVMEEDTNYHGDLHFYARTAKGRVEYYARFTHGYLDWILRPKDPAPVAVNTLERLAWDAKNLEQERATRLEGLLQRLERLDPEVARRAIEVWDDRADAAEWLAAVHPFLGKKSAYEELAGGRRQAVLRLLGQIEYGSYS